jgi:hypothetical protein
MADTDLEYTSLPTTDAIESGDEVLLVRDGVPIRFTGILPTENGVSDAVAEAEAARDAALAYGNATVKATWTEAAALTGLANGAIVLVVNTDTGTHASVTGDVGAAGGQTPNSGVFRYSTSLTALVRIAVLESAVAQAWAESALAPGAAGTKSAKSWVNYLLADTGFIAVATDMLVGAGGKIATVAADLLLGAASKIAIVAADLALGAGSAIRQAISSATAADSSATAAAGSASAAAASAASVPTGAGMAAIRTTGRMPDNVGVTGQPGLVTDTLDFYSGKTVSGWGSAINLKTGAIVNRDQYVTDFAIGTYPTSDLPCVRTGQVTNLIPEDAVRTPPNFATNVAVQHPTYGVLAYPQSTILMSSLNPGNGTFTVNMPVVGKLAIYMNGPGQAVSSAGATSPATATNFGTLVSAPGAWQALNVTAAGNVTLTLSGTDATTSIQVEYRTNQPTFSVPTPFKGSTGTRSADSVLASGTMLSNFQASSGTAIFDVHRLSDGGVGTATIVAFNGSQRLAIVSDTQVTYNDGTHSAQCVLPFATFANSVTRVVLAWSAGKVMLFAGSAPPIAVAFDLNNGVARTAVRYGAPGTDGQQSLCGGIARIAFALNNAALDPVDCYDLANQARPIPKASALVRDVPTNEPFPAWRAGLYEMSQGRVLTNGVWPIFIMVGASTTRGNNQVGATTQVSSIAGRWAIRETAAGYPAYLRGLMGSAGYSGTSAQTNSYNPQMSVSAGWTPGWGLTAGGGTLSTTTAGCYEQETPLEVTNGYRWFLFTNNGGVAGVYGRVQLTATDGTNTATKTFDCNLAAGVSMVEITAADLAAAGITPTAGGITYKLTTLDAGKRVSIAGRFPWNSLTPHVIVLTAGAPGYTAEAMDFDAISSGSVENSWYEVLRQMQPTFMTLEIAGNSSVNQTAFTGFKTAIDNLISKCVGTGADVMMMTNLNLGTTVVAKNIQDKYQSWAIKRVRPLGGCGTFDLYNLFGKSSDLVSMGLQNTDKIHPTGLIDSTHPLSGNDIIAKRFQDLMGRAAMGV